MSISIRHVVIVVPIVCTVRTWVRMNISMGANKFNIERRGVIAVIGYPTLSENPLLSIFLSHLQSSENGGHNTTDRRTRGYFFAGFHVESQEKHYNLCSHVVSPYNYRGFGAIGIRNTSKLKGYSPEQHLHVRPPYRHVTSFKVIRTPKIE